MTIKEIAAMVAGIGLPYAYHHFDEEEQRTLKPPYIRWFFSGIDDLYADNINFQRISDLRIELYTDIKDFDREEAIESILEANGWAYDKTETYLESELLYVTAYAGDIIISKEE
jgi:uncharacterized protein YbcC (UPF0753/DUF2309 family)